MDLSSIGAYYNDLASRVPASAQKIFQLSEEEIKTKSDDELMEVCKQFESYFLEQVFKEMAKTTSLLGEDEDGSSSQMVDYFMENTIAELASQSTEQNSLGLAQTLYEQMKRNYGL